MEKQQEQKTGTQQMVQKLQNLKTRLTSDRQAQTDLDSVIQELQQHQGPGSQGQKQETGQQGSR